MDNPTLNQVFIIVIPALISGIVAFASNKQVQDLRDQLGLANVEIARLKQALFDHNIPLPSPEQMRQ